MAAVLILGGGALLYLTQPEPLLETAPTEFEIVSEEFVNDEGGYAFLYPPTWSAEAVDSATRVLSPERNLSVTFGHAPRGTLRDSVAKLLAEVVRNYSNPQLTGVEIRNFGGSLAGLVAGTAENDDGVELRFLVISMATEVRNYGVTIFTAADSNPAEVLPPVQEMIASFRPLAAA